MAGVVSAWEVACAERVDEYCRKFGKETVGLSIAKIKLENGQEAGLLESFSLSEEILKRRRRLATKNGAVRNVSKQRISSGDE
jgi:hypothetical protein